MIELFSSELNHVRSTSRSGDTAIAPMNGAAGKGSFTWAVVSVQDPFHGERAFDRGLSPSNEPSLPVTWSKAAATCRACRGRLVGVHG